MWWHAIGYYGYGESTSISALGGYVQCEIDCIDVDLQ